MNVRPVFHATRAAAFITLSLGLAGGLAACGSDDSSSSDSSSSSSSSDAPTTDDFVAEANAVCANLYPAINGVGATLDPSDPSTVTSAFLPLVQELQDQLAALTPPDEVADTYNQALASQQESLDAITADPSSIFTLDDTSVNAAFDEIGVDQCGSGSADIEPSAG